ncbi:hypothetical protein QJS04_geneDACA006134 [Acorus gramineus]|uniref:Rhodanese domain-containing protein n=1 Tax=Acorus gramineus TaxID=55184 RepID=A0AAV9B1M6_ACOGR|nr:hypothetical protein QJS04_geneDACA006134 [Acorus gramineus]
MECLRASLSPLLPPLQNLPKPPKSISKPPCLASLHKTSPPHNFSTTHLSNLHQSQILIHKFVSSSLDSPTHLSISHKNHKFATKTVSLLRIRATHLKRPLRNCKVTSFVGDGRKFHLCLPSLAITFVPFPSFAADVQEYSDKINVEYIVNAIDDFFNRNPFFVAGCTIIWLVVIPLTENYLKKCKPIPAINAFRRLKDDPNSQLLDVRNKQSLSYMNSPNLRILNKTAVQVEFTEGDEENFVRKVLENFQDLENTVLCILDNFDGNSMKIAELLFKRGFKEAYAIKGGLRGKDGWQAIQVTLLPPSMHVYPRKKKNKGTAQIDGSRETPNEHVSFGDGVSTTSTEGNLKNENGSVAPNETSPSAKIERSLSPYPNIHECTHHTVILDNSHLRLASEAILSRCIYSDILTMLQWLQYPDLKPPSSPTPSKP